MVPGIAAASRRCEPVAIRRLEARPATWPAPSSAAYPAPIPSANPPVRSRLRRVRSTRRGVWRRCRPQVHRDQRQGDECRADMNLDRAQSGEEPVADEDLDEPRRQADDDHPGQQQAGQPEQRRPTDDDGLPRHQDQYAEAEQAVGRRGESRRYRRRGRESEPAGQERTEQEDQQGEVGPATRAGQGSSPTSRHRGRPIGRAVEAPRTAPAGAPARSRTVAARRHAGAGPSSAG